MEQAWQLGDLRTRFLTGNVSRCSVKKCPADRNTLHTGPAVRLVRVSGSRGGFGAVGLGDVHLVHSQMETGCALFPVPFSMARGWNPRPN